MKNKKKHTVGTAPKAIHSEQLQKPIEKSYNETKSLLQKLKYMTTHFPGLVHNF